MERGPPSPPCELTPRPPIHPFSQPFPHMVEPPMDELLDMENDIDRELMSISKNSSTGDLPFFARNDVAVQPSRQLLNELDDLFGYNPLISPLRASPSQCNLDNADTALLNRLNDL